LRDFSFDSALFLVLRFLLTLFFPVIFLGVELFLGFVQSLIFAMLTLVFGIMAVAVHGEGEHGEHASEGAHS
jgi:F-type H+-transporting ATPase subunit a